VAGFNDGAPCGGGGRVATRVVESDSVGNGVVRECGMEHASWFKFDGYRQYTQDPVWQEAHKETFLVIIRSEARTKKCRARHAGGY
jgi:hypothetical protein